MKGPTAQGLEVPGRFRAEDLAQTAQHEFPALPGTNETALQMVLLASFS
jgi:hypothetical protein